MDDADTTPAACRGSLDGGAIAGVQALDANHERRRQLLAVPLQRPLSRPFGLQGAMEASRVSNGSCVQGDRGEGQGPG